jgi:hypothetical protein
LPNPFGRPKRVQAGIQNKDGVVLARSLTVRATAWG